MQISDGQRPQRTWFAVAAVGLVMASVVIAEILHVKYHRPLWFALMLMIFIGVGAGASVYLSAVYPRRHRS